MAGARYSDIVEGSTRLHVASGNASRGPGKIGEGVFFNPAMSLGRDVNVAFAAVYPWRADSEVLDGLGGCGARWIRVLNESRAPIRAAFCDRSADAAALIKRNLDQNGLAGRIINADFADIPARERFDAVDVDPFGTPAPFLDDALAHIKNKGVLCVTATDTGTLCGTSPVTALRRYDARLVRTPCLHEAGLRALMGFAARTAARSDISMRILASHATDHYYRFYAQVVRGARRADEDMRARMGYLRPGADGSAVWVPRREGCASDAGPLWTGPLGDQRLLAGMREWADARMPDNRPLTKLLERLEGDSNGPPGYYDLNDTAGRCGVSPPAMDEVLARLADAGYTAIRTHFMPLGIKTDAPFCALKAAVAPGRV